MGALYKFNFNTKKLEEIEAESPEYPSVAPAYAPPDPVTTAKRDAREASYAATLETLRSIAPTWANAVIYAELRQDKSDISSDYFGSICLRRVAIGFRKSSRESFPEMRKAAARFPETAAYGPGCGLFRPRVILTNDVLNNGRCYWPGQYSPWHHELADGQTFQTDAAARAFIAEKGEPFPVQVGETLATFRWTMESENLEHREKYSMGAGYYLGRSANSGWHVGAWKLEGRSRDIDEIAPHLLQDAETS